MSQENELEPTKLDDPEARDRLAEAIAQLPDRQKLVIALHHYEDLAFDEIGEILGEAASFTVKDEHEEALRSLRGLLTLERDEGRARPTVLGPDGEPLAADSAERALLELRVTEVSEDFIAQISETPRLVYDLSPRRFEELVAELYRRRGFEVQLTPSTGDEGVDVYAIRHDELGTSLTVVQCKRYSAAKKIGVGLVRELQGTILNTGASAGVLLTTSFFTKGARRLEERFKYQLALHDYDSLQELLRLPLRGK